MARERTPEGCGFAPRGRWFARVTVAKGKRVAALLPWCPEGPEGAAPAGERARAIQAMVNALRSSGQESFIAKTIELAAAADAEQLAAVRRIVERIVDGELVKTAAPIAAKPLTFRAFAERWTSGALHAEYPDHVDRKKTADDDEMRFEKWIYPVVQDVALVDFTLDHALEVLRRVPRELSGSSRRHVAQLMVRVLNLAVYPCRILKASPLPRGFLPKVGKGRAKSCAYPEDDARLCAAPASAVPLANRVLYAFAHREGMRKEEALALTWECLNLELGTVRLDENKTDDARTWTLGEDVAAALRAWHRLSGAPARSSRVFEGLQDGGHLAGAYRTHLRAAGVDRSELFASTKARRQVCFHDTRASFITVALATGKTETWVADRTGHKSSQMINRYRRAARTATELGVGWFAPMLGAIPELAATAVGEAFAVASETAAAAARTLTQQNQTLRPPGGTVYAADLKAPTPDVSNLVVPESSMRPEQPEAEGGAPDAPLPPVATADAVEAALSRALEEASQAGRWDVVGQLARELEARRLARAAPNVVALRRPRRGGHRG